MTGEPDKINLENNVMFHNSNT